jgi:hypothetical protein
VIWIKSVIRFFGLFTSVSMSVSASASASALVVLLSTQAVLCAAVVSHLHLETTTLNRIALFLVVSRPKIHTVTVTVKRH